MDVYLLEVKIHLERDTQKVPAPGQFYMLKSFPSGYQYNRPISVYHSAYENCVGGGKNVFLQFMILRKGQGTTDITKQQPGDKMTLLGPFGNTFEVPSDAVMDDSKNPEICIVGGGIGVAPVANFAASLPENTYDFYASFKTGAYGLGYLRAKNLVITTDDGSVGIKGMLPVALSKEVPPMAIRYKHRTSTVVSQFIFQQIIFFSSMFAFFFRRAESFCALLR